MEFINKLGNMNEGIFLRKIKIETEWGHPNRPGRKVFIIDIEKDEKRTLKYDFKPVGKLDLVERTKNHLKGDYGYFLEKYHQVMGILNNELAKSLLTYDYSLQLTFVFDGCEVKAHGGVCTDTISVIKIGHELLEKVFGE